MKKNKSEKYPNLVPLKHQKEVQDFFNSKQEYEKSLQSLQYELLLLQQELHLKKEKVILVFEGHDAAGKGGVIKRMVEHLDPRGVRVHAIGKPNILEKDQNYFQRFFEKLPEPAQFSVFDRSWYGRVLVERVEGFCLEKDWKRAYSEINTIEKMWIDDGVFVFKYFLDITHEEQCKRFTKRKKNPMKAWKLTAEDIRNRKKWVEYHESIKDMLAHTSTPYAPWNVIPANSKWFSRVYVLNDIVQRLK